MRREEFTFCRLCDICCGMIATVENDVITNLRPNPEHVASRGFCCPKGLAFNEIVHSPDRVTKPQMRKGPVNADGSWSETDWETAYAGIGEKLKQIIEEHGPESVAIYVGTGAGFAFLHPYWAQGFLSGIGSNNLYSSATQDCSNKFVACREMYGFPMLHPVTDFENGECFILLGANPAATKLSFKGVPHAMRRFREASERGCRIVHVNPRRVEAVEAGGEHFSIRPDTDIYFLLAFANELFRLNAVDQDKVNRYMKNLDKLQALCTGWTAEKQEEVTGIEADKLVDLAETFAQAKGASLYLSTGLAMGRNGALCAYLVEAINAFTGNLDKPGGTLVGKGALMDFPRIASKFGIMMGQTKSRLGGHRVVNEIMPGSMLAEEILTPGKGQIKALFVAGGNPFVTLPNSARVEKAFLNLDLLVSIDLFQNLTGNYAHWVLPGLTAYERPDLGYIFHSMMGISNKRYLQYSDAVIPPQGESQDELLIWSSLCKAAGKNFFASGLIQAIIDMRKTLSGLPGILGKPFQFSHSRILNSFLRFSGKPGVRRMRRHKNGLILKSPGAGSFLGKRVRTKDGLVDLGPDFILNTVGNLENEFQWEIQNKDKLKLVNKRGFRTLNSFLQSSPSLMKGKHGSNHLHIHPEDAAKRNLIHGDQALVWSDYGTIRIPVKVTERMSPGSAAVPFGWGQQRAKNFGFAAELPGANVNWLTPSGPGHFEKASLMAHLSGLPIEAAPVPVGIPAVILAGGESRRFGSNKAFAQYKGQALLDHVLQLCEKVETGPILSISNAEEYKSIPCPKLYDPDPETRTPLNGLLAATRTLEGYFLTLTVDSPVLSEDVVNMLFSKVEEGETRPIVIADEKRIYPFPGIYHSAHIDVFEQAYFRKDFRLTELISTMDPIIIPMKIIEEADPDLSFLKNVNAKEDLLKI